MSTPPIVEVRVPTYKRTAWLRRALKSIQQQTEENWKAVVIDDSPEQEGKGVVEALNDSRIEYEANSDNLGGAGNIDRAFEPGSFTGAPYATILEDDNTLMPDFLKANLHAIDEHKVPLILRNQHVWLQKLSTEEDLGRTTRGNWFEAKIYEPKELHAFLFFFEGISNGGMFWRVNAGLDLVVGPDVTDSGLQEFLRTLQIDQPMRFEPEPLAVWSKMSDELITRSTLDNRKYSRGKQSVMRYLIHHYGNSIIDEAYRIAENHTVFRELEEALIESGYYPRKPYHLSLSERLKLAVKSTIKFKWVNDPLLEYFYRKFS